ncbi:MAG: hypothetical protein AB7R69_06285 [Candidatus Babeliales bacterium]
MTSTSLKTIFTMLILGATSVHTMENNRFFPFVVQKKEKLEMRVLSPEEAREDVQRWSDLSEKSKQQIIDAFRESGDENEELYYFCLLTWEKILTWPILNYEDKMLVINQIAIGTNFSNQIIINNKLINAADYFKKLEEKYALKLLNEMSDNWSQLEKKEKKRVLMLSQQYEDNDHYQERIKRLNSK